MTLTDQLLAQVRVLHSPANMWPGPDGETDPDLNLSHPVDSWEICLYRFNIQHLCRGFWVFRQTRLDGAVHFSSIVTFHHLKGPLLMRGARFSLRRTQYSFPTQEKLFFAKNALRRQICSIISSKCFNWTWCLQVCSCTGSLWVTRFLQRTTYSSNQKLMPLL